MILEAFASNGHACLALRILCYELRILVKNILGAMCKIMGQIIYIKAPQLISVKNPTVTLGDFLTIYTEDSTLKKQLEEIPFHSFDATKKGLIVVSVLKIIEMISKHFPDAEINNLGEGDFVISYEPLSKFEKLKENISTIFICLIAFFGGGYAIMAYNTDVGAKEFFTYLSMLFLGNPKIGVTYIVIAYSIGLTLGMLLFFNHLGSKKLTSDPTPLEVQMRLYENDISTTVIKNVSRQGNSIDVD